MKSMVILLATALLGTGSGACGDSGQGANSASVASTGSPASSIVESHASTSTNESEAHGLYDGDDGPVLDYGHTANAVDWQAITALVKRYFAAAAVEDGAKACSLLYFFVAESVADDYGHTPSLRGRTCAEVMSKLFKQHHRELAIENATLKVITVKVEGDKALEVMQFATWLRARKIPVRRERSTWKILELLDGALP